MYWTSAKRRTMVTSLSYYFKTLMPLKSRDLISLLNYDTLLIDKSIGLIRKIKPAPNDVLPFLIKLVFRLIMSKGDWLTTPVKGLLLDISGVLKDGDIPIPGSVNAIRRLQSINFPFRLVTNETLKPRKTIHNTLKMLGYDVTEKEMICPVPALVEILKKENLRPHILMHPRMIPEFSEVETNDPNCVVVGDAAEYFQYKAINECFRKLMDMENPILFSLGMGKYYLDDDGLALDVGAFCKALEYATGVKARVVGKPSSEYFMAGVNDLGLQPHEVVMIGDDIESDVGGAQACGLRGVLVRTGKYRKNRDEPHERVVPNGIVDNLEEAVDLLLQQLKTELHGNM